MEGLQQELQVKLFKIGAAGFDGRPGTQLRTRNGAGRMVQDKTFFQAELRQKLSIITDENSRLNREVEATNKENSNYFVFEKRCIELIEELMHLQKSCVICRDNWETTICWLTSFILALTWTKLSASSIKSRPKTGEKSKYWTIYLSKDNSMD